jgi:peptide-methionine (S)-S-oxide reductase
MGGWLRNPSYGQVCTDKTGHAEVVQVEYDPSVISYEQLLALFWDIHDPTTLNRQGPDIGTQYRSVIFYHDHLQKAAAENSLKRIEDSGEFGDPIVTRIEPAAIFYRAEEYHQRYYERMGIEPHCGIRRPRMAAD